MTAEIAILNRSAIALAADSAVTISTRGQTKIYNSVDKLFQLTPLGPVGVMIFGAADFMGVPIETLIKMFRSSKHCRKRDHLSEYAEDFFQFLKEDIQTPDEVDFGHIGSFIYFKLLKVRNEAFERAIRKINEGGSQGEIGDGILVEVFSTLEKMGKPLKDAGKCKSLEGLKLSDLKTRYREIFDDVYGDLFKVDLSDEDRDKLDDFCINLLTSDRFDNSTMGLVFAGFGEKEIFPTMIAFECEGAIAGEIRRRTGEIVDIDRAGVGGKIVPFAQKEMVERFLNGIDPSFESYFQSAMEALLKGFSKEILGKFKGSRKAKIAAVETYANELGEAALEKFRTSFETRRDQNYRSKIMDMVEFMPKSELAQMAESLVNLTSIKRRVSAEEETVGGDIDVAVISKGDGFVWIKRKHYFDAVLNPRYFTAQRRRIDGMGEDQ